MGSVIPLIEAFLALALTMLALTTAVSAMVGSIQRFLRLRAAGLREMMTYFHRNEVHPLLDRLKRQDLGRTPVSTAIVGLWNDPPAGRGQFLVDMTFLPKVLEYQPGTAADPRLKHVAPTSNLYTRWRNLRFGLDTLPSDEFGARLKASELGHALAAYLPAAEFEKALKTLRDRFLAYGDAASESFGRRATVLSFVCGAILALAANIDSLQLLNTYLASPALRERLISEYEQTGQNAMQAANPSPKPKYDQELGRANETLRRIVEDKKLDLSDEQRRVLQNLSGTVQEVQATAGELRAAVLSATQSFPVGWTLYPNCNPLSPDTRCIGLRASVKGEARAALEKLDQGSPQEVRTQKSKEDIDEKQPQSGKFWSNICWVAKYDPSGFMRWLVGMLLAIAMLGLGTPFWIQVVNGFLIARDYIRGGSGPPKQAQDAQGQAGPQMQAIAASSPATAATPSQSYRVTPH